MAQLAIAEVAAPSARDQGKTEDDHKLEQFLSALTDLSRKFDIAIGGDAELFLMEWEDKELAYQLGPDSHLRLA